MHLSKNNLENISSTLVAKPTAEIFSLPEKVLQFGTGVLLRGLPDYFIDKANRQGIFNGRIVVVKSTSQGDTDSFPLQQNLYTTVIRGLEGENKIEEFIINSSISRVISAQQCWQTVLDCANNPELKIIISNTTEVGITLVEDDIRLAPPRSFPGKLLAFLYQRYKSFKGSNEAGFVIIPTELITDNGDKLRHVILELARMNNLDTKFINWLKEANDFCNSLVDRIVPGKLPENEKIITEKMLGYTDDLMIMAESFKLWAIETSNEKTKQALSFASADDGVIIAPGIEKFRELKLRLLNGTHSFSCALAFLAGFETVKQAMHNSEFSSFVQHLAFNEIASAISDEKISYKEACDFAAKVIDRFKNPYIEHPWINISVQYSSKMKMRNVPLLVKHYEKNSAVPEAMALGFAAFLLFMNCTKNANMKFYGRAGGKEYPVQDDQAGYFAQKWSSQQPGLLVEDVLADKNFWGIDLSQLNGFTEAVKINLHSLMTNDPMTTIQSLELNKSMV